MASARTTGGLSARAAMTRASRRRNPAGAAVAPRPTPAAAASAGTAPDDQQDAGRHGGRALDARHPARQVEPGAGQSRGQAQQRVGQQAPGVVGGVRRRAGPGAALPAEEADEAAAHRRAVRAAEQAGAEDGEDAGRSSGGGPVVHGDPLGEHVGAAHRGELHAPESARLRRDPRRVAGPGPAASEVHRNTSAPRALWLASARTSAESRPAPSRVRSSHEQGGLPSAGWRQLHVRRPAEGGASRPARHRGVPLDRPR